MRQKSIFLPLIILIYTLFITGCSSRSEHQKNLADATIIYPPLHKNDIVTKITFYKYAGQKGEPRDVDTIFTLRDEGILRANVDLENRYYYGDRELMFHLIWIDDDGTDFFTKKIIVPPHDSSCALYSSVSIEQTYRQPGRHRLQVYLFRELIAEKAFTLISKEQMEKMIIKRFDAEITLCRKFNKSTGKRMGIDSVFMIDNKGWIRAIIDLHKVFIPADQNPELCLKWIGPDKQIFYRKKITLSAGNIPSYIYSSISKSPGKRKPGTYRLAVSLFDRPILHKDFVLGS